MPNLRLWRSTILFIGPESPEHAIEIARQCRATGFTKFFAIGGDGTIQEVVNGVLAQGYSDEFVFGALPMGTGNDWMRQYITKASIADYLSALKGKNLFEQDLGDSPKRGKRQKPILYQFFSGLGLIAK